MSCYSFLVKFLKNEEEQNHYSKFTFTLLVQAVMALLIYLFIYFGLAIFFYLFHDRFHLRDALSIHLICELLRAFGFFSFPTYGWVFASNSFFFLFPFRLFFIFLFFSFFFNWV